LQRSERHDQERAPLIPAEMPPDVGVTRQDLARPIGVRLAGRRPGKIGPSRGHHVALNRDVLYASAMLHLVLANLARKKVRTGLTIGSFAVALFLFALLAIVRDAFQQGIHIAGADRLVVVNRGSLIQPLPVAYRDRLARISGVTQVTFATWFGGLYRDVHHSFPQFAIDREAYREMFPECVVPDDQWQSFAADREGAIVGEALAARFGWNVGDRVPIKGALFPGAWEFNIRGVYRGARPQDDTTQFWFHWDYLDERRTAGKGFVGWYTVRVARPDDAARLIKTIDQQFANSEFETKTETEKAFAASWAKRIGNVAALMLSIGGVVFFTLLLITGNVMAIAVRERTRELAVLKAVGFSGTAVLALVIAETLVIAFIGGGLGLALAKLFTLRGDPTGGLLPFFHLPASAIVTGLTLALTVGLLAGMLPALSASRLRIVDALRRI